MAGGKLERWKSGVLEGKTESGSGP